MLDGVSGVSINTEENRWKVVETIGALGASLAMALAATACAPGARPPTSRPPARRQARCPRTCPAAGDVTLTVWDQNTNTGINDAQVALNNQFQQKYPNVKIERVSRSFCGSQDDAQVGPDVEDPAGRGSGQPGLSGHGLLRLRRPAATRGRLREALRLGQLLPAAVARPRQTSPPTARTGRAATSTASPRPVRSSGSTTTARS